MLLFVIRNQFMQLCKIVTIANNLYAFQLVVVRLSINRRTKAKFCCVGFALKLSLLHHFLLFFIVMQNCEA